MALSESGIINTIITNLTTYVFGNTLITSTSILIFFIIFALLIQIPFPFAIGLCIPLIIVLTAYSFLPVVVGGLLVALFLVISILAFIGGVGLNN
jgi:hypothetical protein